MRSLLAWVIYGGLIPQSAETWFIRYILQTIAFSAWLGLLVYLSKLWRDRLDVWCIWFAQWAEEVLLGKQDLREYLQGWRHTHRGGCCQESHSNQTNGHEMRVLTDVEGGLASLGKQ